jgi:hypothetical protein
MEHNDIPLSHSPVENDRQDSNHSENDGGGPDYTSAPLGMRVKKGV